jgi:hypothetical protein
VGCLVFVVSQKSKKKKKGKEKKKKKTTIRNVASHDPLCQERKAGTSIKLGAF